MGTEYNIFRTGAAELTLDEMSCRFDLSVSIKQNDSECVGHIDIARDLDPKQVAEIAKKLVISASYFVDDPDTFIEDHIRSLV